MKNRYNPHSIQKEVAYYFQNLPTTKTSLKEDITSKFKFILNITNSNNNQNFSISKQIIKHLSQQDQTSNINLSNSNPNYNHKQINLMDFCGSLLSSTLLSTTLSPFNVDKLEFDDNDSFVKEYGIDVLRFALVTNNFQFYTFEILESAHRFLNSFYITNLYFVSFFENFECNLSSSPSSSLSYAANDASVASPHSHTSPILSSFSNQYTLQEEQLKIAKLAIETFISNVYYLLEAEKHTIALSQLRKLFKSIKKFAISQQTLTRHLQSFILLLFLPFIPFVTLYFLLKYNLIITNSIFDLANYICQEYLIKPVNIVINSSKNIWLVVDTVEWLNNPINVLQKSNKLKPIFKNFKNICIIETSEGWKLCL